jgi:hypothetical protein
MGPTPQPPIPNPQSPIPIIIQNINLKLKNKFIIYLLFIKYLKIKINIFNESFFA